MGTRVATLSIALQANKYVLTYGDAPESFKEAKRLNDFAVYSGNITFDDEWIMKHGVKESSTTAYNLFGLGFGLDYDNFRR